MCRNICVFTSCNLTCMTCGLEQDVPVFQDEWNISDRTALYENDFEHEKRTNRLSYPIFERIHVLTNFPENIMKTAKEIYKLYLKKSNRCFKGEAKRMEFCTACVYFASKNMNQGGSLSQSHIAHLVFNDSNNTSIYWACKELEKELSESEFKSLFSVSNFQGSVIKITESLPCMVKRILDKTLHEPDKTEKTKIQLLKTCHKIFDILQRKEIDLIAMTHPGKFGASLIFVASKILKMNIKLNHIALLLCVSEPMLLKMEKIFLKNIKK